VVGRNSCHYSSYHLRYELQFLRSLVSLGQAYFSQFFSLLLSQTIAATLLDVHTIFGFSSLYYSFSNYEPVWNKEADE